MGHFPDDDFLLLIIRPESAFLCKLGFPKIYAKGKTTWIPAVVVKLPHRANGQFTLQRFSK